MILDVIVEDKKKRLKEHKARTSEEQMKELALVSERKSISFYEALAKPGLSIIGEFKKASPSMGKIEMTMELMDRIDEYNISVDAISCLTEEDHFLGNTDYFKEIRNISPLKSLTSFVQIPDALTRISTSSSLIRGLSISLIEKSFG